MTDERIEEIIKVTWSRDDVSLSFEEEYKRKPTEQELDDCVDAIDRESLKEAMIERGWDYIDSAVSEMKEKKEEV